MKYAVEMSTVIDGWVNCWHENDQLLFFDSIEEAQAEIDFAVSQGVAPAEDYRIVEVTGS